VSGYRAARLDEIAAEQWPYWAPIRHHFDVRSFGINAWRGTEGDEVIKRHTEEEQNHEEVYIVLSGRATFEIGGEEVDAPAVTVVHVSDPLAERVAFAKEEGTVILSVGSTLGAAYEPSGWDTSYLAGDS
jgi:uncharacterized cupin superfamily protein